MMGSWMSLGESGLPVTGMERAFKKSRDYSIVWRGSQIEKGPKESGKIKENIKSRVFPGVNRSIL
jgi:hypothetical protein